MPNSHVTPDQVRNEIDHGRARDKVDFPDFAAAPLGTDEEAAGTSLPSAAVDAAKVQEAGRSSKSGHHPSALERNSSKANLLIAAGGALAVTLVLLALL